MGSWGRRSEFAPGDTLAIRLINDMLDEPKPTPPLIPHGYNTTNLHTHGLHVSPEDNSDNPFIQVPPRRRQDYSITIGPKHPPGTHWYHPHKHMAVAVQVCSRDGRCTDCRRRFGREFPKSKPRQSTLCCFNRFHFPTEIRERWNRPTQFKAGRNPDVRRRLTGCCNPWHRNGPLRSAAVAF